MQDVQVNPIPQMKEWIGNLVMENSVLRARIEQLEAELKVKEAGKNIKAE